MYNYLFRNFTTMGILSGGAALIISKNQILCKAKTSRMVGYRSVSDRNLKFDWKMFWSYLKPYIGYFIAAVCVSKFFLNFFISKLLSIEFSGSSHCGTTKYLHSKSYG